ncbi:MAG: metallophosphoesterase [Planctomycetaceae bacterium]|nr:metallophosphoesterase [Planctomycetaceae bacterium]
MRITSLNPNPIAEVPYLNAGRGAGDFYEDRLPILEGTVNALPEGVAAILATGDLQFRERFEDSTGGPLRLLGEVLPDRLREEILPKFDLPDGEVGVCLAGDFYTVPALDSRGGSGDVTAVWEAFIEVFDWVAGVAGNHDTFGSSVKPRAWMQHLKNVHYLDGDCARRGELKLGGVGGIVGNRRKPQRKTESDYLKALESVLSQSPDILLMHDGPNGSEKQRGSRSIRETIEQASPQLIIRGHAHWHDPLATLDNGTQVLNVDARLVVLRTG